MPLPSPGSHFGCGRAFASCVGIAATDLRRLGNGAFLIQVALGMRNLLFVAVVCFGAHLRRWDGFVAVVPALVE